MRPPAVSTTGSVAVVAAAVPGVPTQPTTVIMDPLVLEKNTSIAPAPAPVSQTRHRRPQPASSSMPETSSPLIFSPTGAAPPWSSAWAFTSTPAALSHILPPLDYAAYWGEGAHTTPAVAPAQHARGQRTRHSGDDGRNGDTSHGFRRRAPQTSRSSPHQPQVNGTPASAGGPGRESSELQRGVPYASVTRRQIRISHRPRCQRVVVSFALDLCLVQRVDALRQSLD